MPEPRLLRGLSAWQRFTLLSLAIVVSGTVIGLIAFLVLGVPGAQERPSATGTGTGIVTPPPSAAATSVSPTMPATAVASVLLTASEISRALGGIEVSADPGSSTSAVLTLDSSSYGPSDHSREVNPQSCAGVVFTGDNTVYGGTDVEAMKTESFAPGPYVAEGKGPWQLQQTAAVFPSTASARRFLVDQQQRWAACSAPANLLYPDFPDIDVSVLFGYEDGRSFVLETVERNGDMIAISMASNNPVWRAHACQQALGVRNNVVAEARTCRVPPNAASIDGLEPADPAWALPEAQHLVAAMLNKVIE